MKDELLKGLRLMIGAFERTMDLTSIRLVLKEIDRELERKEISRTLADLKTTLGQ